MGEKKTVTMVVKKVIFVASDGQEFDSNISCENYEWEIDQTRKEKEASRLSFDASAHNWVSILGVSEKVDYKWFKLENDEDLKLFCDSYEAYSTDLDDFDFVKRSLKNTPMYPDYICLVDCPQGPLPEWHTLSEMLEKTTLFLSQFNTKLNI